VGLGIVAEAFLGSADWIGCIGANGCARADLHVFWLTGAVTLVDCLGWQVADGTKELGARCVGAGTVADGLALDSLGSRCICTEEVIAALLTRLRDLAFTGTGVDRVLVHSRAQDSLALFFNLSATLGGSVATEAIARWRSACAVVVAEGYSAFGLALLRIGGGGADSATVHQRIVVKTAAFWESLSAHLDGSTKNAEVSHSTATDRWRQYKNQSENKTNEMKRNTDTYFTRS